MARWDTDERGRGVGDGRRLVDGATELVEALREPGWVAEDPDLHLLPHVEAWCRNDGRLALLRAETDDDGGYVLDLAWQPPAANSAAVRAAVFALVGSFAESATYVRQRPGSEGMRFEVGTGLLARDTHFDPHGHVVLVTVRPPA